ncbi:MAG: hypothetical protein U0359_36445 [Byssovorax sp.]
MEHQGADRRRRRVYITRNTEYHVKDGICVAIRDRGSQVVRSEKLRRELRLTGSAKIFANGALLHDGKLPRVGRALCFRYVDDGGRERYLVTSPVEQIGRPSMSDVALLYPPDHEACCALHGPADEILKRFTELAK